MTEIAIQENNAVAVAAAEIAATQPSALMLWAAEAAQAHQIAIQLARTSFVPASLRGKPDDITAAILAGQELGLQPMATLRSMDVIQGTPALRAHAMRGLVQSKGHKVVKVSSDAEKVVMRGKRKGERDWQEVEWTIDRARALGLTGKDQWKKQPETMLIARATGEICRLIASDVLYAMPYCAEELDPVTAATTGSAAVSVTTEEILGAVEPTAIVSGGYEFRTHPEDDYDGQDEPDDAPHDGHPEGEYDPWCRGCVAENAAADRAAVSQ